MSILYDKYSGAVFGIIIRLLGDRELSEEILQESFVKIWKSIEKYDEDKGRLFTWMVTIARNTAIDARRSVKNKKNKEFLDLDSNQSKIDRSKQIGIEVDHIGLKELTNTLNGKYTEVIDLIYFQGYTHVEASEKLGIPLGTVKTRLRKALVYLKGFYKKE